MRTKKYNPGFLTDDELVDGFRVRCREFRSMVQTVRRCTGPSNTHMLVVGPRGSGKTTLLLRVAAELRRDHDLSRRFFPVTFAEETYCVSTCGEFWLEALNRLAHQAPRRSGDPDYRLTYRELRETRDDESLSGRSLGRLLEFADRERKRLVVFVENLQAIFSQLADTRAGWRLRHTLQTEPRILLVASATSRFDAIDDPGEALYNFFQVRRLRPLDETESADLWEGEAKVRPSRATIRTLQILTGGNPRLLAIIARFGASMSFGDLTREFLNLVDDHTEYFRSQLESLPHQQRRVYLALAGLWRPATTREIAEEARITTNQCSAQLKRLEQLGAVNVVGGSPRRMQYYLTERMFNIYYLLRLRGGASGLVRGLVRFIQSYYSLPEQISLTHELAQMSIRSDPKQREIALDVLARLVEGIPAHAKGQLPSVPPIGGSSDELMGLSKAVSNLQSGIADGLDCAYILKLSRDGRFTDAIGASKEFVRLHGTSIVPDVQSQVAFALTVMGGAYLELGWNDDALDVCGEMEERFHGSQAEEILHGMALAELCRGIALQRLGRIEEALESYEGAMRWYGGLKEQQVRATVAYLLFQSGVLLGETQRDAEAIGAYEELFRRFGSDEDSLVSSWVAKGLVRKAQTLADLGRFEEALGAFDRFESRSWGPDSQELRECSARAQLGRARVLDRLDCIPDALVAYEKALLEFESMPNHDTSSIVSRVLLEKSSVLEHHGDTKYALLVLEELATRFDGNGDPAVIATVALALYTKGVILSSLGRLDEAAPVIDSAAARFEGLDFPQMADEMEQLLDMALLHLAPVEGALGRPDRAVETVTRVLDHHPQPDGWMQLRALFMRAFWRVKANDEPGAKRDIAKALELLPTYDTDLKNSIDWLMQFSVDLDCSIVLELVKRSSAESLLLPLATALEQELGREPRVAVEVMEVASDIRCDLQKLRENPNGDRNAHLGLPCTR